MLLQSAVASPLSVAPAELLYDETNEESSRYSNRIQCSTRVQECKLQKEAEEEEI